MVVYPGDPEVHTERVASIAKGDVANITRIDLGVHTGTHVDAPLHFIDGAPGADRLALDALIGPAHVIDATALDADIDAGALAELAIPESAERVLFKTRNSELWNRETFSGEYIRFVESGAQRLVASGVRLVGIDYLSIDPYDAEPKAAHLVLLAACVVVVEGLDLRGVAPGHYELICLPIRLDGSDGVPARVILRALPGEGK